MAHTTIEFASFLRPRHRCLQGVITAALLALLAGCSAPQQDRGGEVYCSSYESNYLTQCRQNCEAESSDGDADSIEACNAYCDKQLAKDDTFNDDCPK